VTVGRIGKESMSVIDSSLSTSGLLSGDPQATMILHDIDRALGAMLAGLGGISAVDLGADVRERLDQAQVSGRTLGRLIAALRAGETIEDELVEIDDLLSRMRARHGADARERGLALEVWAEPDVPAALHVDRLSLVRILDHLLGNALHHSGTGTVRLVVSRNAAGDAVFCVTDEGQGLGTAAGAPAMPGETRGLDIARSLADRIGGSVSLGDRRGGGVEAVLRLPAARFAAEPSASLAGVRILLAEDNLTNQIVAMQMLRALRAEVTICSDGVEALERFDEQAFDLVVVDIEMPRMSGLDVIRTIRARADARGRVPIVALTAYAMREHRERIAAAGANGVISKPVTSVQALGRSLAAHLAPAGADDPPSGPPTAGEAAEAPVIDAATYAALCEAIGPELIAELLDKVIADLLSAQRDLVGSVSPIDRSVIRAASHILISVAGALGALRLQGCARALNASAHTEAEETLAAAVGHCASEIDHAVAFARERRSAL
jgi:two-component system aerobic respiration control sensor histidine kinase ArcB